MRSCDDLWTVERQLLSAIDLGVAFKGVDNDAAIVISGKTLRAAGVTVLGRRTREASLELRSVPSSAFGVMPFHIIPVNSDAEAVGLTAKIAAGHVVPMGQLAEITRGAECGMNHAAISRHKTHGGLPLIDHLDMNRHWVQHAGWYADPSKINQAALKPTSIYQTTPKLLIRFLSAGIVAAKDDVGYASTNLVYHVACGTRRVFCAVFCAHACSTSGIGQHFRTRRSSSLTFRKSHLVRLPISSHCLHHARRGSQAPRQEGPTDVQHGRSGQRSRPILSFVDEHLKASRTDVIHDLLAFLAERMMAMNTEKHETAKGFLTNLKDFRGVDAHSLKPKTRLDEFWKLDIGDVFAHINANRKALAAQGTRLKESDEEKIRAGFLKAKAKIVPSRLRSPSPTG